jgi:Effector Associated Constant Component 1
MSTTLSVISPSIDSEDLDELTLDLCRTINSETEVTAEPAGAPTTQPGDKGDVLTIGSIVLGLISSGGVVVTLINVLKSYLERGRPIEIELEHPDGRKLKIKGDDVKQEQIDQTMKVAREFFGVSS